MNDQTSKATSSNQHHDPRCHTNSFVAFSVYHTQGSKAPEPWHFCGAGSGAGGKRAGSSIAEGFISENYRLLLSSMVQHPAVVTVAEVVTVAAMSLKRRHANQHHVACPIPRVLF